MPRVSTKFEVRGVEPANDWVWQLAGEPVHRQFWRAVVGFVLTAKDRELRAGLDKDGRPLQPISSYTREHRKSAMGTPDPNAPPLTPAYGLSRTRSWFTGRAFPSHAEFFWTGGWGRILHFHRVGAGRLPVRDVIGLSQGSTAWIKAQAAKWWQNWKRSTQAGQAEPMRFLAPAAAGMKRPPAPPKIARIGRFDFENYTMGVGGDADLVRRAADAGYFTGFHRQGLRPKGGGIGAIPKSIVPRRAARAPALARALPKGAAGRGIDQPKFKAEDRARNAGNRTVVVDTWRADAAFRRDGGYYIPPGGGSDKQKYQSALEYARKALEAGGSITQPRATYSNGVLSFIDGRHRFAALRDLGVPMVAISFDVASIPAVRRDLL